MVTPGGSNTPLGHELEVIVGGRSREGCAERTWDVDERAAMVPPTARRLTIMGWPYNSLPFFSDLQKRGYIDIGSRMLDMGSQEFTVHTDEQLAVLTKDIEIFSGKPLHFARDDFVGTVPGCLLYTS